jgi:hypothetical protein
MGKAKYDRIFIIPSVPILDNFSLKDNRLDKIAIIVARSDIV